MILSVNRDYFVKQRCLCLGRFGFKSGPGDWLSSPSFLWLFSLLPCKWQDSALKLGHDLFLPNPFAIHHHSFIILSSTLYSLVTEKASLNKLRTYLHIPLVNPLLHLSPYPRILANLCFLFTYVIRGIVLRQKQVLSC